MQRVNFEYSLKNIPHSSETTYFKVFISKFESFINRIRWKALFFDLNLESETDSDDCEEYQKKKHLDLKLIEFHQATKNFKL